MSIAGSWPKRRMQQLPTNDDGKCYALCANDAHRVMYSYDMSHYDAIRSYKDQTQTLSNRMGTGGQQVPLVLNPHDKNHECLSNQMMPLIATHYKEPPVVAYSTVVRRLMPIECERLMGFPDGWTEGLSDTARYRLLGNAVVVPVSKWIFERILCPTQTRTSREPQ